MTFDAFTDTTQTETAIILHVDMDCFYASCERLREPTLEDSPVVVGMGYEAGEDQGAVATASYEAREYGIESAQPISQALEQLPRAAETASTATETESTVAEAESAPAGYYRSVDLEFYNDVASDVKAILNECAEVVREVSIDEAYLDVTDRTSWEAVGDGDSRTIAEGYARHVKQRISREVGVPASVGVAPTMATAKIASDYDKPDGLTVVPPEEVEPFLDPLDIEAIHGVGPVTAAELREMGVETAGDLAAADPTVLVERFGQRGRTLYNRARGMDSREVTPTGRPKSLSRESAFSTATDDSSTHRERVRALAADVATRAQNQDAMYQTVGLKVVTPPFDVQTRASSLSGPVDDPELLTEIALELLSEFADQKIRKLGVRVSNLSFGSQQQAQLDGFAEAESEPTASLRQQHRNRRPETVAQGSDRPLTDWVAAEGDAESLADGDSDRSERDEHTETAGQSSLEEYE